MRKDYTGEAGCYDQSRFGGVEGKFVDECDTAILKDFLGRTEAFRCLDVPVGTGRISSYLEGEPIRIMGCDFTLAMLKIAKMRPNKNMLGLVQGDGSQLPFANESFDLIFCLAFFHLFPAEHRGGFVREFERILKPGGYLICSFTNRWYGGGLNWVRKGFNRIPFLRKKFGGCGIHFLEIGEIRQLFPNWKVVASHGNFLPFQRKLPQFCSSRKNFMRKLTACFPFNQLCFARFFLLKKKE